MPPRDYNFFFAGNQGHEQALPAKKGKEKIPINNKSDNQKKKMVVEMDDDNDGGESAGYGLPTMGIYNTQQKGFKAFGLVG